MKNTSKRRARGGKPRVLRRFLEKECPLTGRASWRVSWKNDMTAYYAFSIAWEKRAVKWYAHFFFLGAGRPKVMNSHSRRPL